MDEVSHCCFTRTRAQQAAGGFWLQASSSPCSPFLFPTKWEASRHQDPMQWSLWEGYQSFKSKLVSGAWGQPCWTPRVLHTCGPSSSCGERSRLRNRRMPCWLVLTDRWGGIGVIQREWLIDWLWVFLVWPSWHPGRVQLVPGFRSLLHCDLPPYDTPVFCFLNVKILFIEIIFQKV
jgi:hypothetical protein